MALERHIVELSARDTLSPTLRKVGQEADRAGKQAEDASKRASRSMADWNRAASALGLALGAGMGAAIKIFNEGEVVQQRLKTAIENTGAAYDDYADAIDKASASSLKLAFDDEDAMNAISQLTDATGDASKAINDLAIAQDIARGRGIDLAAATQIVIAAETGRFQSLKRLGIQVDENATKEEVLASLQAKYAGQAQAYAETNAATWDRFGNTIENTLESIGGHLADFQGPLVALSAGAGLLGPLGDAFEALDGKAKLAAAGSKALSLALGPAGLITAVGGLTATLVYLVATTDEYASSAKAAEKTNVSLANSYAALAGSIEDVNERERTRQEFAQFSGLQEQAQKDLRTYQELQNAVIEWKSEFPQLQDVAVGALNSISEETQQWLDFNHDGRLSMDELTAATEQFGEKALLTSKQAESIGENLTQALSHADVDVLKVLNDFDELEAQWRRGEITGQQFADGVEAINRQWSDYTPYALKAADATQNVTEQLYGGVQAIADNQDAINALSDGWDNFVESQIGGGHAVEDVTSALDKQNEALASRVKAFDAVDRSTQATTRSFEGLTGWMGSTSAASADLDAQLDALSKSLQTDFPGAASAAYQRVVGFTSGMTGAIKTSKDWADALIAPVGTFSELDNMLANGQIDLEDYNEAQQAQIDITDALTRATAASNEIQVKQADTVADGAKATADYLETLADMPEAQQAVALAWADTDVAGQAMQVADLAAQFGNMNTAQQEAFSQMVTSAAATNPALAAVLVDLGLIKESASDPTGYTVTIPTDGAQASLQDVVDAITALTNAILGIPDATVDVTADTSSFYATIGGIPSIVGDRYINVHGVGFTMATGGVVGAGHLHGIDTAALGRVSAGNLTLVGEHGPELVSLPGGSFVTPNHATRYDDRARGGSSVVINNMTVVTPNAQQFMRQIQTYASTMERR